MRAGQERAIGASCGRADERKGGSSAVRSSWSKTRPAATSARRQKARKLIDRDKVSFLRQRQFLHGAGPRPGGNELNTLLIVTGGHTDAVREGLPLERLPRLQHDAHGDQFRLKTLFDQFGKKWFFITADYAFGHTLQQGFEASLKQYGGTEAGVALTPLGTTDFSSYLIQAQAANPDVIIFLNAGQDAVNSLKQAVQFGLDKRFHIAGAQQELEVLEALPPEARIGTWVFEWYWKQPGVPHVPEFVAALKAKTGRVPTARHWFGFTAAWTCALIANQEKTLEAGSSPRRWRARCRPRSP
jgi:branched-chain amino acid transport system substrate-binding protein